MNKYIIVAIAVVCVIVIVNLVGKHKQSNSKTRSLLGNKNITEKTQKPLPYTSIQKDMIEVVHFHGTQQCWACITVGQYALKTIQEEFPEDISSGKIVYRDINGELKDNQEIVMKYRARGSSLFINTIRDGKDNIEEDVRVWRLVANEKEFKKYFEQKLSSLLAQ